MADDQQQNPPPNPAERFKKWLQLLEAHGHQKTKRAGREQGLVGKPRCVHGEPWDECAACAATTGEA